MAEINKNNASMDFPLQIARQYGAPLDKNSVFYSLADAQTYASSSPLAYVGQVIAVVDEDANTVDVYKISNYGLLESIGGGASGITNVTYEYAQVNTGNMTSPPTGDVWMTDPMPESPGYYRWTRITYHYAGNTTIVGYIVSHNPTFAATPTTLGTVLGSTSENSYSTSLGAFAYANGASATAIGYNANAGSAYSTALGRDASSTYDNSTALGYGAICNSSSSTALGSGAFAKGYMSIALGFRAKANSSYSIAIGGYAFANINKSVAIGYNAKASGENATAIGYNANAIRIYSTALGHGAHVSGSSSTALGYGAYVSGSYSTALGSGAIASANNSIVLGDSNIISLRCAVTSITSLSDERTKEDITLANTAQCLVDVERLPVKRFKFAKWARPNPIDVHRTGFIAQDVEKVFPKDVQSDRDDFPVLDEDGNPVMIDELDENGNIVYEDILDENGERVIESETTDENGETVTVYKQQPHKVEKKFTIEDCKKISMADGLPTLWGAVQYLSQQLKETRAELAKVKALINYKEENTEV